MVSRIIVGVDGSETAAAAARKAAGLAAATGAELDVAVAYGKLEVERIDAGGEEFFFSNENEAQTLATEVARTLRGEFDGLTVNPRAIGGKPAEALVDAARDHGADLIVVGNKRVQGLARVLGSIAADVARHADCDVYIAHTH
ncbi:universal stress protein [Nocardioides massiliensis]|uniref:Nucleotide-binding universal stress UspA family protein n=1 Tax=Nocardioides massiliensis TaxID=1325935 RepID=A0ABT9NVY2_9ACTN|nr:universal stress protein [Nocardioides massiliensis]MDP9823985.1 nucleotide-binding universal stress UspA family protein [Nocardioides massiliensis]